MTLDPVKLFFACMCVFAVFFTGMSILVEEKRNDPIGPKPITHLREVCYEGVVYLTGGNQLAPKLNRESQVEHC